MTSGVIEQFEDILHAHLTVCNRFGQIFHRFLLCDLELTRNISAGEPIDDQINTHYGIVVEASEAITDMQTEIVRLRGAIAQVARLLEDKES